MTNHCKFNETSLTTFPPAHQLYITYLSAQISNSAEEENWQRTHCKKSL